MEKYIKTPGKPRNFIKKEISDVKAELITFPENLNFKWRKNQVYILFGSILAKYFLIKIDRFSLRSFNARKYKKILKQEKSCIFAIFYIFNFRNMDESQPFSNNTRPASKKIITSIIFTYFRAFSFRKTPWGFEVGLSPLAPSWLSLKESPELSGFRPPASSPQNSSQALKYTARRLTTFFLLLLIFFYNTAWNSRARAFSLKREDFKTQQNTEEKLPGKKTPVEKRLKEKTSLEKLQEKPEEIYIEVERGVKLHTLIKGKGKDIILIHGLFGSAEMFESQFRELPSYGFRVIAISLRGFGKSSKPRSNYTYPEYAKDIEFILNTLNVKNAILIGYSMGTPVIVKYFSIFGRKRLEKIILIGAPLPVWVYTDNHPIGFSSRNLIKVFSALFTKRFDIIESLGEALVFSPLKRKEIILTLAPFFFEASLYAGIKSLFTLYQTDLYEDLKKIDIPVLLIHGKEDMLCPINLAYELKSKLQKSALVIIEKSGHGVLFEESVRINKEILEFSQGR